MNALEQLFTQGNLQRKVGGTKMNAESSRSHSVFSILLEVRYQQDMCIMYIYLV